MLVKTPLVLSVLHIDGLYADLDLDRFQWDVLGIPSKLHPDGGVDRSPTAELACEKRRPLYRRWLRDQHWLERTGNDERELREIFYWLRATSNLEIFVHDLGGAEKVSRDYRKISEEYGDSPAMWSRWDNHRPLQVVLDAIKESSLRPSSFVSTFKEYAIPLSMFGGSETGFGQLLESFRNLTCLDLELQAGPGLPDSLSDDTAISNVLDFLKQVASQLLILELNAFHERDAEYTTSDLDKEFDKMISEVFFSHIEELTLNNITVDYERLLLYLSVHQRTLEEYGLYEILATGTGTDLDGREFNKKVVNDLVVLGLPEPMEYIV